MRISDWSSDVCSSDLEEHQLRVPPHRADFRQPFGQAGQVVVAVAHVDADRELARRVVAAGDAAHEAAQQLGRQVVDAVEPEVLEGLQRHRLAAARQPADDQQDGLAVVFRRLAHGLPRSRKWECRAMNAAAGATPFARRMCMRVAASVSTARLRPGITCRVISGTSRSGTRRWPRSPVRRSMPSPLAGSGSSCGGVRWTIRRRYLFRFTAVSPNISRMLSTPRPRSSRSEEHTSELQSLMRLSY